MSWAPPPPAFKSPCRSLKTQLRTDQQPPQGSTVSLRAGLRPLLPCLSSLLHFLLPFRLQTCLLLGSPTHDSSWALSFFSPSWRHFWRPSLYAPSLPPQPTAVHPKSTRTILAESLMTSLLHPASVFQFLLHPSGRHRRSAGHCPSSLSPSRLCDSTPWRASPGSSSVPSQALVRPPPHHHHLSVSANDRALS